MVSALFVSRSNAQVDWFKFVLCVQWMLLYYVYFWLDHNSITELNSWVIKLHNWSNGQVLVFPHWPLVFKINRHKQHWITSLGDGSPEIDHSGARRRLDDDSHQKHISLRQSTSNFAPLLFSNPTESECVCACLFLSAGLPTLTANSDSRSWIRLYKQCIHYIHDFA